MPYKDPKKTAEAMQRYRLRKHMREPSANEVQMLQKVVEQMINHILEQKLMQVEMSQILEPVNALPLENREKVFTMILKEMGRRGSMRMSELRTFVKELMEKNESTINASGQSCVQETESEVSALK